MWKQIVGLPIMDGLVKKPDLLSFYIASKIPVSESTRQELLEIDGISYRLRREIELLQTVNLIRCKTCQVFPLLWNSVHACINTYHCPYMLYLVFVCVCDFWYDADCFCKAE